MSTLPHNHQASTLGFLATQVQQQQQVQQTCKICNKYFKKISHYNRHMRERHTQQRTYVCKQQGCGKTFKRSSHLKRHMISHTNQKSHPCSMCHMNFGYKHHLERHIRVIHLSQRLECVICSMAFKKKKAYHKHMEKVHKEVDIQLNKKSLTDDTKYASSKGFHQEQLKNEDIYDSSQSGSEKEIKSQKLLYRCNHQNCLSAFQRFFQFKRHLSNHNDHIEDNIKQ